MDGALAEAVELLTDINYSGHIQQICSLYWIKIYIVQFHPRITLARYLVT